MKTTNKKPKKTPREWRQPSTEELQTAYMLARNDFVEFTHVMTTQDLRRLHSDVVSELQTRTGEYPVKFDPKLEALHVGRFAMMLKDEELDAVCAELDRYNLGFLAQRAVAALAKKDGTDQISALLSKFGSEDELKRILNTSSELLANKSGNHRYNAMPRLSEDLECDVVAEMIMNKLKAHVPPNDSLRWKCAEEAAVYDTQGEIITEGNSRKIIGHFKSAPEATRKALLDGWNAELLDTRRNDVIDYIANVGSWFPAILVSHRTPTIATLEKPPHVESFIIADDQPNGLDVVIPVGMTKAAAMGQLESLVEEIDRHWDTIITHHEVDLAHGGKRGVLQDAQPEGGAA